MAFIQTFGMVLGVIGVVGTALPLVPSGAPAIRIWDFPRAQLAAVLAVSLLAIALAAEEWTALLLSLAILMTASLLWQVRSILPYTRLTKTEVASVQAGGNAAEIKLLSANVLITNRDVSALFRVIDRARPDVVLLVETDLWWNDQLQPLRTHYPHVITKPQDNSYGMHLFSRFELVDTEVRHLVEDAVPSIKTKLRLNPDIEIALYCVHPEPPPFVPSEERDAELLMVGKEVRREGLPSIVAGDLNDVAWSRSTRLFQKVSGLLDPRVGRGAFNTFSAKLPFFMRWPLDHVFFSEHFHLIEVAVLDQIGSDHFPFFVHLAYREHASGAKPTMSNEDKAEADRTINEGQKQATDSGHA